MDEDMIVAAPRRGLFGRLAGTLALGLAGFAAAPADAEAAVAAADWPGKLKGRHRQVVDAVEPNKGFPLVFALTYLMPNAADSAAAVVVLRHGAFPIALGHDMWAKYKIGESFNIVDPETKAPAVKNPWLNPKAGVLVLPGSSVDALLAKGVVFGACNMALLVQSKMLSGNAGTTPEEAAKEWTANVIPGITIVPSGTWAVNRAQEAGCTYCAGG
jgi:intracellular sulfur oxidation DsrE/DsrF family protein